MSDAGSASRKRARVAQACEFCRKSRRKCDGKPVCGECAKRGLQCVYAERRGRAAKSKRIEELESQIQSLKGTLAEYEHCASPFAVAGTTAGPPGITTAALLPAVSDTGMSSASASPIMVPPQAAAAATAAAAPSITVPAATLSAIPVRKCQSGDMVTMLDVAVVNQMRREAAERASMLDVLPATVHRPGNAGVEPVAAAPAAAAPEAEHHTSSLPNPAAVTILPAPQLQPLLPSAKEEGLLRLYFDYTNKVVPAVDENAFSVALSAAQYDAMAAAEHALKPGSSQDTQAVVNMCAESISLRAAYYFVLSMGAHVRNDRDASKQYADTGRLFLGYIWHRPSTLGASALILAASRARSIESDYEASSQYAVAALRAAEQSQAQPAVRVAATVMYYACCGRVVGMPALVAPEGLAPHVRFAEILGFAISQLLHDFPSITDAKSHADFFKIQEEAAELQAQLRIFTFIPMRTLSKALRGLLYAKSGELEKAAQDAKDLLRGIKDNKLVMFSFPVVSSTRRLVQLLKDTPAGKELEADAGRMLTAFRSALRTEAMGKLEAAQRAFQEYASTNAVKSSLPVVMPPLSASTAEAASALAKLRKAGPSPAQAAAAAAAAATRPTESPGRRVDSAMVRMDRDASPQGVTGRAEHHHRMVTGAASMPRGMPAMTEYTSAMPMHSTSSARLALATPPIAPPIGAAAAMSASAVRETIPPLRDPASQLLLASDLPADPLFGGSKPDKLGDGDSVTEWDRASSVLGDDLFGGLFMPLSGEEPWPT